MQVRSAWEDLRTEAKNARVRLYCNAASVQVNVKTEHGGDKLFVEWVGQRRKAWAPAVPKGRRHSRGLQEQFDIVILAVGFGVEADGATSYWRNETLSQPALRRRRRTYVVSGAGDGGWIDLFRIRISDFRQDRILAELFGENAELLAALRRAQKEVEGGAALVPRLREIWRTFPDAGRRVILSMDQRLRHDTEAVLHVQEAKGFDALLNSRVSFQNQLLAWVLHAAGGFSIWGGDINKLTRDEDVSDDTIVIRHGSKVDEGIERVLGPALRDRLGDWRTAGAGQVTRNSWSPGYFGTTLRTASDQTKKYWKREYLPASTEIVAASVCGAVAGVLRNEHPADERLRITLHRVLQIGANLAFQQCCDYSGVKVSDEHETAGRTFPLSIATIGHAYRTRSIVRSRPEATFSELQNDALGAGLAENARSMASEVASVLAIPLIFPVDAEDADKIFAILYVDSLMPGFFASDDRVQLIAAICKDSLEAAASELRRARAISNFAFPGGPAGPPSLPDEITLDSLETVDTVTPPRLGLPRLNLDQTTFLGSESPR